MAPIFYFILFLFGLFLVIKGSDWFIDSAVWAAEVFRIPPIIIGATVVSICTTLPETFVSATAALRGQTDMAIENSIGSIGVNTGFIMAILIIHSFPVIENSKEYFLNGFFLIFILFFIWVIGFCYNEITPLIGGFLLLLMLLYILNNIRFARKAMDLDIQYDFIGEESVNEHLDPHHPLPAGVSYDERENDFDVSIQAVTQKILFFVIGVGFVMIGSRMLVENGIQIAINIVQVIGVTALVSPIPLQHEKSILLFQLPCVVIMILFAVVPGVLRKNGLTPWNGVLLLVFYLLFLTANILRESTPILGQYLF